TAATTSAAAARPSTPRRCSAYRASRCRRPTRSTALTGRCAASGAPEVFSLLTDPFVPAQAGTQGPALERLQVWVPAFAGTNDREAAITGTGSATGAVEDLPQIGDVLGESAAAGRTHAHARLRLALLEALLDHDVAGLLERIEMRAEIAVGRSDQSLEPRELDCSL